MSKKTYYHNMKSMEAYPYGWTSEQEAAEIAKDTAERQKVMQQQNPFGGEPIETADDDAVTE